MDGADLIITITDRSRGEEFAEWYQSQGIPLVLTALGRGTATRAILDCLGLEATEKAVLLCVAAHSHQLVHRAAKELWLDVPGRGVSMAVPVSSIGGAASRDYLLPQQEAEEHMKKELTHELILVITDQGHTDQVMEAARGAGATGGTVVHAKGTGAELARQFFGMSIASEREVVFILAREANRKPIMKAIMARAGMQSEAHSIVFSLPVSGIAGLRTLEEDR